MNNVPFCVRLRLRGMTQEALARAIGSSRAHVCQVLNGVPGRGGKTRKKLAPLLTDEERALLCWDAKGNLLEKTAAAAPTGRRYSSVTALMKGEGMSPEIQRQFHAEQNVPIHPNP